MTRHLLLLHVIGLAHVHEADIMEVIICLTYLRMIDLPLSYPKVLAAVVSHMRRKVLVMVSSPGWWCTQGRSI